VVSVSASIYSGSHAAVINEKKLVKRGGKVLAVIRPSDPQRAIAKARACRDQQELNAMLGDPEQTYTFIGLAAKKDQRIIDPHTGKVIDRMQPGDSFVPHEDLVKNQKAS